MFGPFVAGIKAMERSRGFEPSEESNSKVKKKHPPFSKLKTKVEEAPKNTDAIRVPRKRTKLLNEAKLADLGCSQTVFDPHTNPVGKRQSYSQSSPDTSSRHTQPDSSGKKSKRLHMDEEEDDEDERSYSYLQFSQASEHPLTSALCHLGQHLDHVEIPSFGFNLDVSDMAPKTSDSLSLDTARVKAALTSIEKEEPGDWNLTDELERSETKKSALSFQKVHGAENKKGTCVAEQRETC